MNAGRLRLKSLPPEALRKALVAQGFEGYRADQVLGWVYQKGVEDVDAMTNLTQEMRLCLASEWEMQSLRLLRVDRSSDGTRKFLLEAADGARIESVLIPEPRRNTLCISTQVGCPLACSFCATGAMGFIRNLAVDEIVDQLCQARAVLSPDESITNLVFMGMGEPLLNLPRVIDAIGIFMHPKAFGMAPRRITVSTAGVAGKIRSLLEAVPINLAVSLHATTDEVRDQLVPLNREVPLADLLGTLREEPLVTRRHPVFFEYTLMAGVNDSVEDARRLPGLVHGIPCRVNVIPMNPHPESDYRPPAQDVTDRFTALVHEAGLRVTLRRSRGSDIAAACGQLANQEPLAPGVPSRPLSFSD